MVQPDPSTMYSHLIALYGQSAGNEAFERLRAILKRYGDLPAPDGEGAASILSERDTVLITYADQLSEPDTLPSERSPVSVNNIFPAWSITSIYYPSFHTRQMMGFPSSIIRQSTQSSATGMISLLLAAVSV